MRSCAVVALFATFSFLGGQFPAFAQDTTAEVAVGGKEKIDRYGICRMVSNDGRDPVMVPLGSAAEWGSGQNSFLNNLAGMPGVKVSACGLTYAATAPENGYCSGISYGPCFFMGIDKARTWRDAGRDVYELRVGFSGGNAQIDWITPTGGMSITTKKSKFSSEFNKLPEVARIVGTNGHDPNALCAAAEGAGIYIYEFYDSVSVYTQKHNVEVCE